MKRIIILISICLCSILLPNENASSKSSCKANNNIKISHSITADSETEPLSDELKPYDGFFLKI